MIRRCVQHVQKKISRLAEFIAPVFRFVYAELTQRRLEDLYTVQCSAFCAFKFMELTISRQVHWL